MRVRELAEALLALPEEYQDSIVVTTEDGMGGGWVEMNRLVAIPELGGVHSTYKTNMSFDIHERVIWMVPGGDRLSQDAEDEGWKVVHLNTQPVPPTRRDLPTKG
jgi:hypothetical protein